MRLLIGAVVFVTAPIAACYVDEWRPWDKDLQFIRQPRATIQDSLLRETPAGSSTAQVRALIVRKHWHLNRYNGSATAIEAQLGEYHSFPFSTGVWARWEFSPDGRLVDLKIVKATDGP